MSVLPDIHFSGYALWTVSPESTGFILLIGVCWDERT